ncbi:Multidrug resistance protein MdtA precursor [Thalassoglobus neptunius]|uniref:Multidrug resistance protein MdtA n=1 Tax=Thalassoglobus neptunius TaxID=1938619 RepID=A0A5C5X3Y1_9PLAN|nr:efflux RND transporter periplasmic adaptor subunit [Thalassoglobus neptunius]TWT57289.1 Multidrug resistance protein MdtA precursor [Thalassoglobus neptunius]
MSSAVDLRELAIDRGPPPKRSIRARRNMLTRYVFPIGLIFGFVALVFWASRDWIFPPRAVTVMPVLTMSSEVQQEGTPLFKAAGWIEPRPTPVRVAALAPGVVDRLLVVEDQLVQKGDVIAELVKDDSQLEYERSLADFQLREAELIDAQAALTAAITRFNHPVHLEAALGEAEAMLARIETELANLPFELRRALVDLEVARKDHLGKSSASDVVAEIHIDIAKGKLDSAKALVDELKQRRDSLEIEQAALKKRKDALLKQLELLADEIKAKQESEARLSAAKARLEQARVSMAEAKLKLDRMTIRAPIDGRIFRLIAHPGTRIGGSSREVAGHDASTVVTMYDPNMLQVRVDVRFEDVPKVQLNQPVEIDNPTLATPIRGNVLFVSSEADIQKNTLQVKVGIPQPPAVFKPEMLVDVTFIAPSIDEKKSASETEIKYYLPQQLIQHKEAGPYVWTADQSEGVAHKTSIVTGDVSGKGLIEIESGLTPTSRVLTTGTDDLRDGERIRITHEDTSIGR